MRGAARRFETLGSHLICAFCRRQAMRKYSLAPSQLSSDAFRQGGFRSVSTESNETSSQYPERKFLWQHPRSERAPPYRSIVSPQLNQPGFLHGDREPTDSDGAQVHRTNVAYTENESQSRRRSLFFETLRGGQPDQIFTAMLDPLNHDILCSLSDAAFVEAFLLLSPDYFIIPYREILHPLHPAVTEMKRLRSIDIIFSEFANGLGQIARTRHAAGHNLGLAEYTHLLRSAASMGDFPMAQIVMDDMDEDGVTPDLQCFNHFLEAMVWDHAYSGRERYRLRVTPTYYRKRAFGTAPDGWEGFRTAEKSVRKRALNVFKKMTDLGIDGDCNTFTNIFLASSRVGHMLGLKSVLKTVWNVDTNILALQGEAAHPPVTSFQPSSPLYPNHYLLFAVAHAFGNNNDMATAVRAVDFIARQYKLPISTSIWHELLVRSYLHSKKRFGPDAARNSKGNVSHDFVIAIHKMMIASLGRNHTRMEEYRFIARMHWDSCQFDDFRSVMDSAYTLLQETRRKRKEARQVVEEYLGFPFQKDNNQSVTIPESLLQSPGFAEAVYDYDILRWLVHQQTLLMERIAKLLVIQNRWIGRDRPLWERVILPRAIYEWQDFLPQRFEYILRGEHGGLVMIEGKRRRNHSTIRPQDRVPIRRCPDQEKPVDGDEIEIDDDALWAEYRASVPNGLVNRQPLRRLFSFELPRIKRAWRKKVDLVQL